MKSQLALAGCLVLAACATQPPFANVPADLAPRPASVAAAPKQYRGQEALWGGAVVGVRNEANHSEIEVLAYPLDRSQRPLRDGGDQGRFIALLPGYVESADYPAGLRISVLGRITGSRSGRIGEHAYVWPEVSVSDLYRWSEDERERPRFHFGIGVGIRR